MLKVAAITGGATVPSARFRVRQYIPSLLDQGIFVEEMYPSFGKYPPEQRWLRPLWAGATLLEMFPKVIKSHCYDVVLLQREMLSTLVTLEPLTKKPRVLDVDDAIFLHRNGVLARRLAQMSDRVICGNAYLANWFGTWNRNVTLIPTAVDTERYVPRATRGQSEGGKVIGWIGTSGNLNYVYAIEAALAKVMETQPNVKIRIVCDQMPKFRLIDMDRFEFIRWSENIEVESIQGMDVGIMPLEDSEWARGKCSFKMLQYMSCGLPVVVSPVGMNAEVLAMGNVGIGASTQEQWQDALIALLDSASMCSGMGAVGRRVAVESFSIHALAPRLATCLRGACG
jgi:glycosyltransferase involved in cell wall biosynthesis